MKYCHGSWMVYTCSTFLFYCLTKQVNSRIGTVPFLTCPILMVFLWKESKLCSSQRQFPQIALVHFSRLLERTLVPKFKYCVLALYTFIVATVFRFYLFLLAFYETRKVCYAFQEENHNLAAINYFCSCHRVLFS